MGIHFYELQFKGIQIKKSYDIKKILCGLCLSNPIREWQKLFTGPLAPPASVQRKQKNSGYPEKNESVNDNSRTVIVKITTAKTAAAAGAASTSASVTKKKNSLLTF